jgi:hypothetical protein
VGVYASARGWIQMDFEQRETASRIIEAHRHDPYSGGWAWPAAPFNWSLYLFYGGDIRVGELPWLREQLAALAAMPPVDEDDDRPEGLFVISVETSDTDEVWRIRDGRITAGEP